jgi:hypothetical protein
MKSRELQQYLSEVTIRSVSDIDQRCRGLRKNKKIRSGPRGLWAAHVDEAEAAIHVLCLASERAGDAFEVSKGLSLCWLAAEQPFHDAAVFRKALGADGDEEVRLVVCLAAAMVDPSLDFVSFELSAHGNHAWANIRIGGRLHRLLFVYGVNDFTEVDFYESESRSGANMFVIGGEILREIGRKLAETSEEGS